MRTRGLYDPLISREASVIWPIRQTRGVNRGYRDQFFRPDDSSVTIQGVGTPVVYRGDRLPKELYGDAFITDSTTNLVHRYKMVDDGSGRMKAVDGYDKGEILASSDERFRPVNMLPAPDGTLYVVDMYRGIVQEQIYWTDFLRDYINARDLVKPVNLGRIWRIVHDTTKRDQPPALSKAPAATLVKTLSHPNGWWRDKAQQLLVERGDATMAPQLKQLAMQSADWRARLHALWTLDGLDAIGVEEVQRALTDKSAGRARGRDPAVGAMDRAAEPCADAARAQAGGRSELDGPAAACGDGRRAAAAGAGPTPPLTILSRYGADPIAVDAAVSGLRGVEGEVLGRLMRAAKHEADAVSMLAGAVSRSGNVAAVEQLVASATDASVAAADRTGPAAGHGARTAVGGGGGRGGRGGGGGGGGGRGAAARRVPWRWPPSRRR